MSILSGTRTRDETARERLSRPDDLRDTAIEEFEIKYKQVKKISHRGLEPATCSRSPSARYRSLKSRFTIRPARARYGSPPALRAVSLRVFST